MLKFIEESNNHFTKGFTYAVKSEDGSALALVESDWGDLVWVAVDERFEVVA